MAVHNLGRTTWSHNIVAQHKMSHDTGRPYRPHYHDAFYVAQPCCTNVVRLNFCPCGRTLKEFYKGGGGKIWENDKKIFQEEVGVNFCNF